MVEPVAATLTPTAVQQAEATPTPVSTLWKASHDRPPAWLAAPGGADVGLINLCGQPEQCELGFVNTTQIACTVQAVEGRKITAYHLAPDGQAVFFTHDTLGSSTDAPEAPYASLASLDGSWVVDMAGKEVYERFGWNPALLGVLWRPK